MFLRFDNENSEKRAHHSQKHSKHGMMSLEKGGI